MPVANINSFKYFIDRWETIDPEYNYSVPYHESIDPNFTSLPTFVAEFHDCKIHSCPLLLTRENKMITEYVWTLTHKSRHKPNKSHKLWTEWGDRISIDLPPVTQSFNESHVYVWLPIDEDSCNNPWHVWIDMISKFRLMEKRWSTNFARFCYIVPNYGPYFKKIVKTLFPDVKIVELPKNETWQFKHLLVPSMSNSKDGVIVPPLAPWLRHFKGLLDLKKIKPHKKIVVLRPGAKTRRLVNSDELLLKLKGWDTVSLENLSIKAQMQIFAESTHILAAHGAGLINLLWCRPGTKIIEIQDKRMVHKKVYPLLSHNLDLQHKLYLANTVPISLENGNRPKGVKRFSDMINFKINIPDILEHLE